MFFKTRNVFLLNHFIHTHANTHTCVCVCITNRFHEIILTLLQMMYFYSVVSFFENTGHDELHDFMTQSNILPCNLENTKLARYQLVLSSNRNGLSKIRQREGIGRSLGIHRLERKAAKPGLEMGRN